MPAAALKQPGRLQVGQVPLVGAALVASGSGGRRGGRAQADCGLGGLHATCSNRNGHATVRPASAGVQGNTGRGSNRRTGFCTHNLRCSKEQAGEQVSPEAAQPPIPQLTISTVRSVHVATGVPTQSTAAGADGRLEHLSMSVRDGGWHWGAGGRSHTATGVGAVTLALGARTAVTSARRSAIVASMWAKAWRVAAGEDPEAAAAAAMPWCHCCWDCCLAASRGCSTDTCCHSCGREDNQARAWKASPCMLSPCCCCC